MHTDSLKKAYDDKLVNVRNTSGIKDYVRRLEKGDMPTEDIDQVALMLSNQFNQEITTQDMVNFISDNPKGLYEFREKFKGELRSLQTRAREVIGIELTPKEAQDLINAYDKYQKNFKLQQNTEILSQEDMYDLETGKILMESFAKLRELNNTLSKNC